MNKYAVAIGLSLLTTVPSFAHSWYDYACCSDDDCDPIDSNLVTEENDEYVITVKPGDHKLVKKPMVYRIKKSEAKNSKDFEDHLCLNKYTQAFICYYKRGMGS